MKEKELALDMKVAVLFFVTMFAIFMGSGMFDGTAMAQDDAEFTTDFPLEDCRFRPWGKNLYFNLTPGYQLLLEGKQDDEEIRLLITVLHQTENICFRDNTGRKRRVRTRVVEEREWVDGELEEVSRNFFARCKQTNAIYYFGEDVDIYEDGEIVSHEGAWRAGEDSAMPGLIMPGIFLLGSRYFQEIAPGVAMDRAEHVAMERDVDVLAGRFSRCVEVVETTPLDEDEKSTKVYCPDIGLVTDDEVELVEYGYRLEGWWPPPDED